MRLYWAHMSEGTFYNVSLHLRARVHDYCSNTFCNVFRRNTSYVCATSYNPSSWRLLMKYILLSFSPSTESRRVVVNYKEVCAYILDNCLEKHCELVN